MGLSAAALVTRSRPLTLLSSQAHSSDTLTVTLPAGSSSNSAAPTAELLQTWRIHTLPLICCRLPFLAVVVHAMLTFHRASLSFSHSRHLSVRLPCTGCVLPRPPSPRLRPPVHLLLFFVFLFPYPDRDAAVAEHTSVPGRARMRPCSPSSSSGAHQRTDQRVHVRQLGGVGRSGQPPLGHTQLPASTALALLPTLTSHSPPCLPPPLTLSACRSLVDCACVVVLSAARAPTSLMVRPPAPM